MEPIDKETAERIEKKLDRLLENQDKLLDEKEKIDRMAPIVEALGHVLVRHKTAADRTGIHPTTITQNDKINKFEELGHRRVFIEVGDISVVKRRRRRK